MDKIAKKTNKKLLAVLAVLAVAFVVLAAVPAVIDDSDADDGRTVYVGSAGNDTTGDGTEAKPYATLKKALEIVNDGDTIRILGSIKVTEVTTIAKAIEVCGAPDSPYHQIELEQHLYIKGVDGTVKFKDLQFYTTPTSKKEILVESGTVEMENVKFSASAWVEYGITLQGSTVKGIFKNVNFNDKILGNIPRVIPVELENCKEVRMNYYSPTDITVKIGDDLKIDRESAKETTLNFAATGSGTITLDLNGSDYKFQNITERRAPALPTSGGLTVVNGTLVDTNLGIYHGDRNDGPTYYRNSIVNLGDGVVLAGKTSVEQKPYLDPDNWDKKVVTVNIVGDVDVTGELIIAEGNTLNIENGATLRVSGKLQNNGTINIGDGCKIIAENGSTIIPGNDLKDKIEYAEGAKVVIGGNEYTVYHYVSGDIDIQYGISCGDVFYTGERITKKDVSVIAISLSPDITISNKTHQLDEDPEIINAGTYPNALSIIISFSMNNGQVSVTSNLDVDLIVKPAPLDIRFDVPDEYNGIAVGDFQKLQIGADGKIAGKVGYYNLADGMDGYYLVITAQVKDKKGNPVPDAQISTEGMVPVGDGKYMLFLGRTSDEVRQKLDSPIGFTAECGPNYIVPESKIDIKDIHPVDVMSIRAMGYQNILGASYWALYDTLNFVAKNDPTQFEVTGKLLWKANYTGFSSDFNETRGWYIPFHMYNNDTDADFWKNSTADIQILKLKENAELDGEFVFRIVDINVDPVITLKDPNGFKTRYVLDISGIEFGSATGYGETQTEAEDKMSWKGIEPEKLTENGSDVIDKTMFMIFNTSAYRGQKVIATATNITDGKNTSYSEEIQIGEDQNICIWYFSFDDQFQNGKPGVYELEVKAGDDTVAEEKEAMKGVKIFTFGFEEKAEDAKREINDYRLDIEDVDNKTFYMIAGIYGYPLGTKITASMLNSNEFDIIMNSGTIGVNAISLSGECDERKYAFYFSFDNGDQVTPLDNIYGLYNMRLMNGNDVIASQEIKVAAKSWLEFRPNDSYNEYIDAGSDLALVQSQTDPTKISLTGKLNHFYEGTYQFGVTWNDISDEHPNAVIKSKALNSDHEYIESKYVVFGFIPGGNRVYEITVDFDGDEPGYEPTTYTFTFDGEFAKRPYGIYLSDPFYGDEPLEFTLVNETPETDTSPSKKFMFLPSGPDGSKKFIGWQSEDGKLYSAGAFVIIHDDMDSDNDGKAVFAAVYANEEAEAGEFTVKFDGEVYGTYEAGEMLTLIPVPAGKIAWAVNGSVISGQYTVLRADADEEKVISFESVAKVNGIQRTEYTISKVAVEGGFVLVKVDSEEVGEHYFNMNGHFYYKLVSGTQSDIVPSKEIYAFGEKYTEMMPIKLPENYETKGYAVYFCVDYGQQTIVLSKILVKPTIYSGYYEKASIANKAISKFSGEKIEDAVDKTAFMTFDVQEEGEYEARCLLGNTTVISETLSISAEKIVEKHANGKLFVWYFTFGPGNVSTNPVQIEADHVVPGGVYTIEIVKSGIVVASAQISLPSV